MDYSISRSEDVSICEILVTGAVDTSAAIDMLDEVWADEAYQHAGLVVWDMERCESLPDFNQFLRLVNHARRHKPQDGPTHIAFYSSAFSNSMLARVLNGFIQALPYNMALFAEYDSAVSWFKSEQSNAA